MQWPVTKACLRNLALWTFSGCTCVATGPIVIPIFAFFGMFRLWWTKGRDPRLRPIAAQYEPPDGLTPGEVGTVIDNSVDMRDITASIVDLAVRGFLSIEEKQKDHLFGLTHSREYVFHLKKARTEWGTLKPHEQILLDGIFAGGNAGDAVALSDLHNSFLHQYSAHQERYIFFAARKALLHAQSKFVAFQLHFDGHRQWHTVDLAGAVVGQAQWHGSAGFYYRGPVDGGNHLRFWVLHVRTHGNRCKSVGRRFRF